MPQKQAAELLARARDRSAPGRTAFVLDLYELCADGSAFTGDELAAAIDILLDVVHRAPVSVRQQLAERLARDPRAPRAVVNSLARDEISIAFTVLTESPVLEDDDLIEILHERPLEHQLGTLQREKVSEKVSAAFVEGRDPRVMRWLLENPGASIPRAAMEIIVEASYVEAEMQRPLVSRADLPHDLAVKVQGWATGELRERLSKNFGLDTSAPQTDAPPAPRKSGSAQDELAAAQALDLGLRLRSSGELRASLLLKALRAGQVVTFDGLFARFCGISLASARRILAAPDRPGLAIALKAQGIDKGTFASIYMLLYKTKYPGKVVAAATLANVTAAFDRLSMDEAMTRLGELQAADPEAGVH